MAGNPRIVAATPGPRVQRKPSSAESELADILLHRGRLDESLPLAQQAARRPGPPLGPDHPDTLVSRNNLALAYLAAGRTAEAHRDARGDAQAEARRSWAPTTPTRSPAATTSPLAYIDAGRTAEAVNELEETLKAETAKLGADHHEHAPHPQ